MRIAAISALGLMLAAGGAWAQSSYDYRDRDDSRSNSYNSRPDSQSYGDRSSRGGWSHDDHHPGARAGRGATFYLKNGDKEFRVDCGEEDSTRECVDAALMMFRQVQDTTRTTSSTYSPASGSATGSTTSGSTSTGSSVTTPGTSGSSTGR